MTEPDPHILDHIADPTPFFPKRRRGFACLDKATLREIARLGGQAAQASGRAHRYTSEEAKVAGRKGGLNTSQDREHMARIGRHGALVRHHGESDA